MQAIAELARDDRYMMLSAIDRRADALQRARRFSDAVRLQPIAQSDFDAAWRLLDFYYGDDIGEVDSIIRAVSARFRGVSLKDMKSIRRNVRIVAARQMAMYIAREITSRTFTALGRHFGGRDHTTVMHAWEKYRALMLSDADIAQTVAEIIIEVQGQST